MSYTKGQGGRRGGAEDEGESSFRARFVVPASSMPWLSLQLEEITQIIFSLSPAATGNLSCSSNSKLSMQNNQLGNFTNPDYPGLLPTQISPETRPGHYLDNQLQSPTCLLLPPPLPKMHKQALDCKEHNCIYANCDHASKSSHSTELIISHILTWGDGC